MKKTLSYFLVYSILVSCSTSNQVVSNKLFQKRKYQKGWYINSSKTINKENGNQESFYVSEVKQEEQKDTTKINQKVNKTKKTQESFEEQHTVYTKIITVSQFKKNNVKDNKFIESNPNSLVLKRKAPLSKSSVESEKKKEKQTLDREDRLTRILLGILGVFLILYLSQAPLAIFIAIGKGESLRINLFIYLLGLVILAMSGIIASIIGTIFAPVVFVPFLVGLGIVIVADIHALSVIFRGY